MAVSIGGFSVIAPGMGGLRTGTVYGTDVRLTMREDVLPLFLCLAREYHRRVAPLRRGECGAYNYRQAMAGGGWSDHAAGVAMDLNWSHEGAPGLLGGMSTMSPKQVRTCAALKQEFEVVIWGGDKARGGDYAQPRFWDPMHYALRPGVTRAQVRALLAKRRIGEDGRFIVSLGRLGLGKRSIDVLRARRAVRRYLGLDPAKVSSWWNLYARAEWRRACEKSGLSGVALLEMLGEDFGNFRGTA